RPSTNRAESVKATVALPSGRWVECADARGTSFETRRPSQDPEHLLDARPGNGQPARKNGIRIPRQDQHDRIRQIHRPIAHERFDRGVRTNLIPKACSQELNHILSSRPKIHILEKTLEWFVRMEQMKQHFLSGPVQRTKSRDLVMKQVSCLDRVIERIVELLDV